MHPVRASVGAACRHGTGVLMAEGLCAGHAESSLPVQWSDVAPALEGVADPILDLDDEGGVVLPML
jgi:hypothetical protein